MKYLSILLLTFLLVVSCNDDRTTGNEVTIVLRGSLEETRVAINIDKEPVFDGYVTTELTTSVAAIMTRTLSEGNHTISCFSPAVAETTFTVDKKMIIEVSYNGSEIHFVVDAPGGYD
jgi:hypothetical protein